MRVSVGNDAVTRCSPCELGNPVTVFSACDLFAVAIVVEFDNVRVTNPKSAQGDDRTMWWSSGETPGRQHVTHGYLCE